MKRLLVTATAVAMLGGPAMAQPQDQDQGQDHHRQERPEHQQGSAPARSYAPPTPRGPAQGFAPTYQAPQGNFPGPRNYAPQNRPAPTYRTPETPTGQYGGYRGYQGGQNAPTRPNTGQFQGNRQYQGYGQYQGGQYQGGQWNRQYQGGQWNRQYQGGQYQGGQWNRNGQLSGDWWRGRRGFERYEGHRHGYWFAPGWGYYQVDPRWYGYNWEIGGVVPYQLRSYYVSDFYDYGLPPAPYGCAWVFLGDEIVLIDLESGEIIEIAGSY